MGKKHFVKMVTSLVTILLKMMLRLCIYFVFTKKTPLFSSLFKIYTLNFTMYTLTILTYSLKTYVIRLRNLTSINIIFFSPQKIMVFVHNWKEKA